MRCVTMTSMILGAAIVWSPPTAAAQDRPVVFVHGIFSSGDSWAGAAARLQERLSIIADTPNLSSGARFETQGSELQAAVAHHDASLVAVGHSNGGLVSRELSQRRPVSGIITVGTPHHGAPLVNNLYAVGWYHGRLGKAISDVFGSFAYICCNWQWIVSSHADLWQATTSASYTSVAQIASKIAPRVAAPVTFDMRPGSGYVTAMNDAENLAREAASVSGRVGIVSTAHNFYYGGVLRAAFPDYGDQLYLLREAARIAMEVYAAYIYGHADYQDWAAFDTADVMMEAARWLGGMDSYWCAAVSSPNLDACWVNDTIVPGWSQVYPTAAFIDTGWHGPTHTQQTSMSDALLEHALTVYMGVRHRGENPPPPQADAVMYEATDFVGDAFSAGGDRAFVGWEWNDRISSIHVPAGRTVTLFEHADFGGESLTLDRDVNDLRQYPGPGADGTWNDVVSSIHVR